MNTSGDGTLGFIMLGAAIFLVFLPIVVAQSRGRGPLVIGSLLLSVIGAAALVASASFGLGGLIFTAFAAACWFGGLFCGITAFVDAAAERRTDELAWRLLHNEAGGLQRPSSVPREKPSK